MVSPVLLAVFAAAVAYKVWQYMWYKPPNFPPGPPRIPLFGSYLILLSLNYRHLHIAVQRLCRYYGQSVIGFYHGPLPVIVCNDIASIREAVRNPALDGKPDVVLTKMRAPDYKTRGLFFTENQLWHTNRRFSLRHMRDFGYGRRMESFELDIAAEVQDLLALIRAGPQQRGMAHEREYATDGGVRMLCPNMFYVVTGNAILRVLCNEVAPAGREQAELYALCVTATEFAIDADAYARMFSILPFLPYVCPDVSGYTKMHRAADKMYRWTEGIVRRHWENYERMAPEAHVEGAVGVERSFLEMYFKEMRMQGGIDGDGTESHFNMPQLIMTCVDFVLPSIATLSSALNCMVLRWCIEPAVLQRIQAEIDEVVGAARLPNLDDRVNLPYTEAALREIMRMHSPVPNGFPHCALEATQLAGYDVPKGAFVVTNLQAAHWDAKQYPEPLRFRPERFLDRSTGRLAVRLDTTLPFGAGKRLCAGETFSRNLAFMLVTALAQSFNVSLAADANGVAVDAAAAAKLLDAAAFSTGIVAFPPSLWVNFEQRA